MFIVMRGGDFPYPVGVAAKEAVAIVRSALLPGEAFYIEVPEFKELLDIPVRNWQGDPVIDRPLT